MRLARRDFSSQLRFFLELERINQTCALLMTSGSPRPDTLRWNKGAIQFVYYLTCDNAKSNGFSRYLQRPVRRLVFQFASEDNGRASGILRDLSVNAVLIDPSVR